ncbi:MAG: hypothetical protein QM698_17030 [Micropepsaceae bacterium]
MTRRFRVLALTLGIALAPSAAAGPFSDALGACFTQKATTDDHTDLARWMFSAMALHPAISSMANVTPEQRAEIDQTMGALFMRLLTVDCRAEAVTAIKNEGPNAIAVAFQTLGQIAGAGLMTAPEVAAGMSGLEANLDTQKLSELAEEAAR